jgi:hypothetical protein
MQDNNSSNTTTPTKRKTGAASGQYENPWVQPAVNKVDSWFDSVLGAKAGSVLPQNTRQALQQNNGLLGSRLVRWCLALYIGFSLLLTSFHVTSWIFKSENSWKYERTYDAGNVVINNQVNEF